MILLMAVSIPLGTSQAQGGIEVENATVAVDFGKSITFTAKIKSSTPLHTGLASFSRRQRNRNTGGDRAGGGGWLGEFHLRRFAERFPAFQSDRILVPGHACRRSNLYQCADHFPV